MKMEDLIIFNREIFPYINKDILKEMPLYGGGYKNEYNKFTEKYKKYKAKYINLKKQMSLMK